MIKMRYVAALLTLSLLSTAHAAPIHDLDWVTQLKGVRLVKQQEQGGKTHLSYTIHNIAEVETDLEYGLQKRWWVFSANTSSISPRVGSDMHMVVGRDSKQLQIDIHNDFVKNTSAMQIVVAGGVPTVWPPLMGINTDVVLNYSNFKQAFLLSGSDFGMTGSHNTITFQGRVRTLTVSGSDNNISMPCNILHIVMSGNHNTIRWQKVSNMASAPQVENTGAHNSIESY